MPKESAGILRAYRALFRALQAYSRSGLPLTGLRSDALHRTPLLLPDLDTIGALRRIFRQTDVKFNSQAADSALARLRGQQRDLLAAAGEDDVLSQVLGQLAYAQEQAAKPVAPSEPGAPPTGPADAWSRQVEAGLSALFRSTELPLDDPVFRMDPEGHEAAARVMEADSALPARLDHMAAESQRMAGAGDVEAEHVVAALWEVGGVRCVPHEWLYERLSPLHLHLALPSRKGMPFSLAVATALVARRCGLHAVPLTGSLMQGAIFEQPAPGVDPTEASQARRRAAAQVLVADRWVVRVARPHAKEPAAYVDVFGRGGVVGADEAARLLFGSVEAARLTGLAPGGAEEILAVDMPAGRLWAYAAGQIVQCYQRCGMADDVARWLYVKLALDPAAEEWSLVCG
ncbi:unnamed protein product [Pedinophyceae sp. YPF-701]|nr:unnamed protein product [Pedinophyceae sp. YPF-701]